MFIDFSSLCSVLEADDASSFHARIENKYTDLLTAFGTFQVF